MKNAGKSYIALGMVSNIRVITTKKGDQMAFVRLNDYTGQLECVIFPSTWKELGRQIELSGVYAFKGKLNVSREEPSFIIDSIENANELETRAATSVHIKMDPNFNNEAAISQLKDFLFDKTGNCSVYLHIDTGKNPYIIKVNEQLRISPDKQTLDDLKEIHFVNEVWTE